MLSYGIVKGSRHGNKVSTLKSWIALFSILLKLPPCFSGLSVLFSHLPGPPMFLWLTEIGMPKGRNICVRDLSPSYDFL